MIQSELKVPKAQFNKFGNYFYRKAEDITEAAKPLLAKHNCQLVMCDEIIVAEGRHYVKATATFTDSKGLTTIVTAFAREEDSKKGMDGAQITGGCSSYARKYALGGLFLLDDNLEPDMPKEETQSKGEPNNAPNAPTSNAPVMPKPTRKPAPKPQETPSNASRAFDQIGIGEQLNEAKELLKLSKSEKRASEEEPLGVADVFRKYPQLADNKDFIDACKKRKEELVNGTV